MKTKIAVMLSAALWAGAATATAQEIISLGDGCSTATASNGGSTVFGAAGSNPARWTISGSGLTLTSIPGGTAISGASDDGVYAVGLVTNSGGLGGLSTTATLAARWSEANGWQNLGLMTPNAALGVTGSGVSSGSIHAARDISATGRFVVGQGYIAPSNSFRFRPWIWDANANGGAGEMIVLPTEFDTARSRYRDGRALAVSDDGMVIVGGEDPSSSSGQRMVWRYNSGTSQYDYTLLPNGIDPNTNLPYTGTVDTHYINAAGTIIVGLSFEYNATLGFAENQLTKWTWDSGTSTWNRQLLGSGPSVPATWWTQPSGCTIPPTLIPTAMTDDGNTIVGIVVYSTCGSFVRGAFIWHASDGQILDLYDYMVANNIAGIDQFAPPTGGAPRIGYQISISPADGQYLSGWGTPAFSTPGPAWAANLGGSFGCIPAFVTNNPATVNISRCASFIMNAGGGGTLPVAYQWYKDNAPLNDGPTGTGSSVTGATTAQLRITYQNPQDAGVYYCQVNAGCGASTQTTSATAQVDPAVPTLANDTCLTAAPVIEGTNLMAFNPCGAWYDDGSASCQAISTADAWFSYTPSFSGDVRIETCGANYDTVVSVFDGCGGNELACNDNRDTGPATGCSSNRSRIGRLNVMQGVPVLIRVAAVGTQLFSATSSGNLSIFAAPALPANDSCNTATPAIVGSNPFDTTEATADGASSCLAAQTRDVWFVFTPPAQGHVKFATCPGTTMNTVMNIFDSCGGNELACNDNASVTGCSTQSIINNFPVQDGFPYYVRVGGNSLTTFGAGVLTVTYWILGDMNCDGVVDNSDIDPYVLALLDPVGYAAAYPNCNILSADTNHDGTVDNSDIDSFVSCLLQGGCD